MYHFLFSILPVFTLRIQYKYWQNCTLEGYVRMDACLEVRITYIHRLSLLKIESMCKTGDLLGIFRWSKGTIHPPPPSS